MTELWSATSERITAALDVAQSSLPIVLPFAVAYFAYRLGLRAYKRQKEYELVRRRYLELGVDEVCAGVEASLEGFRRDWAKALFLLRQIRDTTDLINSTATDSVVDRAAGETFQITAHMRIAVILGDRVFYHAHQHLAAFVASARDFFTNDLGAAIRSLRSLQQAGLSANDIFERYHPLVMRLNDDSKKYYVIIQQLLNLASALETRQVTLRDAHHLKDKGEVKQLLHNIRAALPELEPQSLVDASRAAAAAGSSSR